MTYSTIPTGKRSSCVSVSASPEDTGVSVVRFGEAALGGEEVPLSCRTGEGDRPELTRDIPPSLPGEDGEVSELIPP